MLTVSRGTVSRPNCCRSFQHWLADVDLPVGFEYARGTLVVDERLQVRAPQLLPHRFDLEFAANEERGIVLGGSGNGEQIAANKVNGIRAALAWNESTAKLARDHNDANVIAIGARQHTQDEVLHLIELFIAEPFSHDERHVRRIGKIATYEQTGEIVA